MTDPSEPPNKTSLATSTYVLAGCGLAAIVGFPIAIIVALTVLGSSLDNKFQQVQKEICATDPNDPSCR